MRNFSGLLMGLAVFVMGAPSHAALTQKLIDETTEQWEENAGENSRVLKIYDAREEVSYTLMPVKDYMTDDARAQLFVEGMSYARKALIDRVEMLLGAKFVKWLDESKKEELQKKGAVDDLTDEQVRELLANGQLPVPMTPRELSEETQRTKDEIAGLKEMKKMDKQMEQIIFDYMSLREEVFVNKGAIKEVLPRWAQRAIGLEDFKKNDLYFPSGFMFYVGGKWPVKWVRSILTAMRSLQFIGPKLIGAVESVLGSAGYTVIVRPWWVNEVHHKTGEIIERPFLEVNHALWFNGDFMRKSVPFDSGLRYGPGLLFGDFYTAQSLEGPYAGASWNTPAKKWFTGTPRSRNIKFGHLSNAPWNWAQDGLFDLTYFMWLGQRNVGPDAMSQRMKRFPKLLRPHGNYGVVVPLDKIINFWSKADEQEKNKQVKDAAAIGAKTSIDDPIDDGKAKDEDKGNDDGDQDDGNKEEVVVQ